VGGAVVDSAVADSTARDAAAARAPHLRNTPHNKGLARFKKTVARQAAKFPRDYFLETGKKTRAVALTFDGGPDPKQTPRLLKMFAKYKIKVTFFLVGERVKRYPKQVKAIVAAGHAIGGHGYTHVSLKALPMRAAWRQINRTQAAFQRAVGFKPGLYRPPYGAVSDKQVAAFGSKGIKTINWSVDSFDWDSKRNTPRHIKAEVLKHAHNGAIILLHSGSWRANTARALPGLITQLRKRGHTFETIPTLLGIPAAQKRK